MTAWQSRYRFGWPGLNQCCTKGNAPGKFVMIRWVVVIFIALIVFSSLLPWLEKLGIGRLPGDLRFKLFGKVFSLPFASTILLSCLIFLVARLL
jgi:hypothetical protein